MSRRSSSCKSTRSCDSTTSLHVGGLPMVWGSKRRAWSLKTVPKLPMMLMMPKMKPPMEKKVR